MRGKPVILAAAATLLFSCNVFFSAKLGRWNILDPAQELVTKTVSLQPILEGYVNEGDGGFHADSKLRVSKDAGGSQNASLLLFDLGEIPLTDLHYLKDAELVLYCASLDSLDYAVIYPVRQPWSTAVTYPVAVAGSFIDNTIDIGNPLSIVAGSENRFPVFPILEAWFQGMPNYGLRLHGDPNFNVADTLFHSSSAGLNPPRLVVSYYDQP